MITRIPFDERYWDTIASRVFERCAEGALRVLVPAIALAKPLRAAIASHMSAHGMTVTALPRITTLSGWVGDTVIDLAAGPIASDTARQLALFDSLRRNAWLANGLAAGGPTAMWAMARQLIALGDDLSRAAFATHADRSRINAAIAAHYHGRAQVAASPEAELVLGVWHANSGDASDPVTAELRAMQSLVDAASQPLLVIRAIGPQAKHEAAFLRRYGERAPVEIIEVDVAASLAPHPAMLAAWPELSAGLRDHDERSAPLLERAKALAKTQHSMSHVVCLDAASLEEEATAAASRIVQWLASESSDAPRSIALVALDRRVARRVRALLERAKVLPIDESGWRLSTTTAAGALMRWLDLASPDGATCESATLLDWAKSGFAWADLDDKPEVVATIERAIRSENVSRGWDAVIAAVVDSIDRAPRLVSQATHERRQSERLRARMHLRRLHTLATVARGRHQLSVFFDWLRQALIDNGMHAALRADRVGAKLLDVVEGLADAVARAVPPASSASRASKRRNADRETRGPGFRSPSFTYAEWRGLLADALESATVRDTAIDSPVTFTSLVGAALRRFDAVVVIGTDASHFPTRAVDDFFLTPGLRAELGLGRREEAEQGELATLALVLAQARHALVTWQAHADGEARLPASAIERLLQVERIASTFRACTAPREHTRDAATMREVQTTPVHQPAPAATMLVPMQITASQANAFISCPYRFFARTMLGLAPLDDINEEAEKRDYGEVVHGILETFHRERAARLFSDDRADRPDDSDAHREQALRDIAETVFTERIAANPDYLAWRARWMALVPSYIAWWRDWTDQGWRFDAAETKREVAYELDADGAPRTFTLRGRLDRVDRSSDGARVAILDYKARPKSALKKELADPGEDVQLPFYRLLMREAGTTVDVANYLSVDRARVESVSPTQPLEWLSELVEKRLVGDFRRLHEGAPMRAQGIAEVCKRCDMRGLCRKGAWVEGDASVRTVQ